MPLQDDDLALAIESSQCSQLRMGTQGATAAVSDGGSQELGGSQTSSKASWDIPGYSQKKVKFHLINGHSVLI